MVIVIAEWFDAVYSGLLQNGQSDKMISTPTLDGSHVLSHPAGEYAESAMLTIFDAACLAAIWLS